jgi:hypothetical protein
MSNRKAAARPAESLDSLDERLIAEAGQVHAHLSLAQIEKIASCLDLPQVALKVWLSTFNIHQSPTCSAAIAARALATWLWAARIAFFEEENA